MEEILKPVEKFVKKELIENCHLWDAEPQQFRKDTFRQIEKKLGILQLPEIDKENFISNARGVVRLLASGCGSIAFIYAVNFAITSFLKERTSLPSGKLFISPVIIEKDDWLFYFKREKKLSGKLDGIIAGDLGEIFFLPVARENDERGWLLIEGTTSYSEENSFLPGLRPLTTGRINFENFSLKDDLLFLPQGEWFEEFKSWFLIYLIPLFSGLVENALNISENYAKERFQGGQPIIEIPSVRRLLNSIRATLATLNHLSSYPIKSRWIEEIRKIYISIIDDAEEAILNSIQVMGGYGYMQDYRVERILRDFRSIRSIFSPLEYITE